MKLFSVLSTALLVAVVAATPQNNEVDARDIGFVKRSCPNDQAQACCNTCAQFGDGEVGECCQECGCN
ncbi:hypothetical protein ABZX51_005820 [Aspergillus tubingensis]